MNLSKGFDSTQHPLSIPYSDGLSCSSFILVSSFISSFCYVRLSSFTSSCSVLLLFLLFLSPFHFLSSLSCFSHLCLVSFPFRLTFFLLALVIHNLTFPPTVPRSVAALPSFLPSFLYPLFYKHSFLIFQLFPFLHLSCAMSRIRHLFHLVSCVSRSVVASSSNPPAHLFFSDDPSCSSAQVPHQYGESLMLKWFQDANSLQASI